MMELLLKQLEQIIRIRKMNYELEELSTHLDNKYNKSKSKVWEAEGASFELENELFSHFEELVCDYLDLRKATRNE